jgi:hypothetical protein
MAAPSYTTDLSNIITDPTSSTGWTLISTGGGGANSFTVPETDDYIQSETPGTYGCISRNPWSSSIRGMVYNSSQTIAAGNAVFMWTKSDVAQALASKASGGIQALIGSGTGDLKCFYVSGNDDAFGGWKCYPIDPTQTPSTTIGSPTSTTSYFGVRWNVPSSGPSKGFPFKIDAIRRGRTATMTSGDVSNGYATFSGLASYSGNLARRWGLFIAQNGVYLQQGRFKLGIPSSTTATRSRSSNVATLTTSSAHGLVVGDTVVITGVGGSGYNTTAVVTVVGSATSFSYANTGGNEGSTSDTGGTISAPVDFRDSNKILFIQNTEFVSSAFNRFEVNDASSRVDWTNINISALGTVSKGEFEAVNNADININGCVFVDMNTFIFQSNSSIVNSTFRRTGLITTGGATFSGCTIDNNTASSAMLASSPANAALISNTDFTSDGTGHAIEITGTADNFTLTNNTYTGYAVGNGSTGNEAVYVNIGGGSLNLTVSGGNIPSIRTAGCAVTVIAGAVSATVNCKTTGGTNIQNVRVLLKADAGGPFPSDADVTIVNSYPTATVTHATHGLATNDKVLINGASHWQNNGVFSITVTGAGTYTYTLPSDPGSSPTGTIKSTFVVLEGLTDGSGNITMSRVFPSNQPVSGWARKSSATPFYKTSALTGTVNSGSGFSATAIMILDE